ncbi:MAG: YifB family Mg chelatase-like AAA ATPase [Candidatus Campbellbacteria bacterium]|nr:YifB family Mg chelatase-like AAA ATPase [Candidatus Campbellbacteria bacterium]
MSFAKVYSAQTSLLAAHIISVEVDVSNGLHAFSIVGLPDKAVEESRDRVSAAIKNSNFESPKSRNQKIVISLAPADIKKEGPLFDVAIALAYLRSQDDIRFNPEKKLFLGELSLDGDVRRISGVLPLVIKAQQMGFTEVFVPSDNTAEAALVRGISVFGIRTLKELIVHLNEKKNPDDDGNDIPKIKIPTTPETEYIPTVAQHSIDFSDVRGQTTAKRALEIAAAGGHNIALWGPPGTGKTLLAKALVGILPPLSFDEMLEVTAIHSVAGLLKEHTVTHPPFRSPHHTSSYVSLVGGGAFPKPGEITLAHRGVLFLDEFPEFDRRVIESLRQPLEDRVVSVARVRGSAQFPADTLLVAALNPCPCGKWGSGRACTCSPHILLHYQRKISGPVMDRIDLWVEVAPVEHADLSRGGDGEASAVVRERVLSARALQTKRFENTTRRKNSDMNVRDLDIFTPLTKEVRDILNTSAKKLDLSARAYHRVIKIARTIADLENTEHIERHHILEALQYRPKMFGAGM